MIIYQVEAARVSRHMKSAMWHIRSFCTHIEEWQCTGHVIRCTFIRFGSTLAVCVWISMVETRHYFAVCGSGIRVEYIMRNIAVFGWVSTVSAWNRMHRRKNRCQPRQQAYRKSRKCVDFIEALSRLLMCQFFMWKYHFENTTRNEL